MEKKEFKTESKKLLDMMVNSIYTNKEIFLRELVSNASDAIDKLYFRSLTDDSVKLQKEDYEIRLSADKEARTLCISDNGCGMSKEELEDNLGTIAKSGSLDFKKDESHQDEQIDIIGQFGVGFYSAFMVADRLVVDSRVYGSEEAYRWESSGADGYTIESSDKAEAGTTITIYLKENTDDENYDAYLEEYTLRSLIRKYSDYIRYPIRMRVERERLKEGSDSEYETVVDDATLNSMIPLWKKAQSEVSEEEYSRFYQEKYFDFEAPLKVIRQKAEGTSNYEALLFIPSHAPMNYYSKDFEGGLQLYSSGVLIMDKCKDLLPDHYSFVRGLVDSSDLSLNISREMLQQDRQLKIIAKALDKKITNELNKMLKNEREKYEQFFQAFGSQLKWGVYSSYGSNKEQLQDLLLFKSSHEGKYVTLKEYTERRKEGQNKIYYASGDSMEKISLLPQVETAQSHGYEVLYLCEDVDEFTLKMLQNYAEMEFSNVCVEQIDLSTEEEKEILKQENEQAKELFDFIKESIDSQVQTVRFTDTLEKHPVCLSSEGTISVGMEKVLNRMPGSELNPVKAQLVLELNRKHPLIEKLKNLYETDKETLKNYSRILYAQARLISGLSLENPSEISTLICDLMLQ